MKLGSATLLAIANAQIDDERKVPPRHPLQRLDRLVQFSEELLNNWFGNWKRHDAFVKRFSNAADRMENAFSRNQQKCGFYDSDLLPHGGPNPNSRKRRALDLDFDRYDREDPFTGTKQITTGFRKWAERYIADCNGQKVRYLSEPMISRTAYN